MHKSLNTSRTICFAFLSLFCCWSQNASAQHTWTGATGNWSDAANWSGGVPASGSANLSITFDNTSAYSTATQDLANPFELQEMAFNNGMYLEGSPIRFKNLGAGPKLISNSASGYWISSDLIFDDTVHFDSTGGATYNYISGNISGVGGIEKNGTDNLQLMGNNTFSGGITINEGWITASTAGFNNNDVVFNDPGTIAGVKISFDQSFDGTYSGDVSGGGSLSKTGSGTLTLGGSNSYTGLTSIGAGTLRLESANALSANSSGLSIGQNATLDLNGFDIVLAKFGLTIAKSIQVGRSSTVAN